MIANGFMPKQTGMTIATFLTDQGLILFVKKEAELEGRTISNWLRKELKEIWKRREEERKRHRGNKKSPDDNPEN
jgi:hypothetical protein